MSGIVIELLIATTIIDFGFATMLIVSMRRRPEHYWFCGALLSLAFWALGIIVFLSLTDEASLAAIWVREYYIAAATIALTLLQFTLHFPRRVELSLPTQVGIWLGYAAMCATIIFQGGIIEGISLGGSHSVLLRSVPYTIFATLFIIFCAAAVINLFRGEYYARTKRRRHLAIQMRLVLLGSLIALASGGWFNLILPMFNDYQYLWVGPICSLTFTFTVMFAVIRQGLFDVRQAFIRSSGYVILFGGVAVLYTIIIYVMARIFYQDFFQSFSGMASVQLVLALIVAVTVVPLKRWYDQVASRVFYPETYDNDFVIEALQTISQREIQTKALVIKSLRALAIALEPRYAVAYIRESEDKIVAFNSGEHNPTPRQEAIQRTIVERHSRELPSTGHVYDIDHLRRGVAFQLLTSAQTGAFVKLEAGGEFVGMVFFGRKAKGRTYHDKDLKLFDSIKSGLALAIQNTLRFREIEQFTQTLEKRVQTATRELRTSNAKLTHLDEAKDEFISMASHQLRTPLTSVKGYIDMVLEGDVGKINAQQKQLLTEAFESSERMVHLINDFLNVSRLQTGKFMIEKRPVDLAHVVEQEVDALKTTATAHNLRLGYRKPARFPMIKVDENKIRQVIMNFIDNAIYYSRPSTTIMVKLHIDDGDIVLEVVDTGIGVPKDAQKHLFTKFFRAGNARKQRPDGTGVGLFLAKKVITAHHGQVLFHSVEGKGSTFGFRLPLAKLRVDGADDTDN